MGKVRITRIGKVIADNKRRIFLADSHGRRKHLVPGGLAAF